jgi:hypothetical protein
MSFPKLFTRHYNVNGLNVYRSPLTIFVFFVMILYFFKVFLIDVNPLFYQDWYVSSEFKIENLKHNMDIKQNTTQSLGMISTFWENIVISKKIDYNIFDPDMFF